MSRFTDVFILPISKRDLEAYRGVARRMGRLYRRHGALRYREFVADGLRNRSSFFPLPAALKLKAGEIVVYSAIEYRSEAHRNRVMDLVLEDPASRALGSEGGLFDLSRMVYSPFKLLVEA